MHEHGSIVLYVHGNHEARQDGQPRTDTSTLTQLLNYVVVHGLLGLLRARLILSPLSPFPVPDKPSRFCGRKATCLLCSAPPTLPCFYCCTRMTVVLAECPEDLQRTSDMFRIYCEVWGLDINVRKTKVMIFSRGENRKMPKFSFNEETVDVLWDYKYLGVKFNYVTECIVYMFRAIPFNLFFPVLFLFDWVGFLWPNYLRC